MTTTTNPLAALNATLLAGALFGILWTPTLAPVAAAAPVSAASAPRVA